MLPSKTIPEVNRKGHARTLKAKAKAKTTIAPPKNKVRACSVEAEETEDNNSPCNVTARNASFNSGISLTSSFQVSNPKKVHSLLCCAQSHLKWDFRK